MIENKTNDSSKQKIIAVATKLFAQKGFDGVSIRDICKHADVNISMISYYFGGKQELYQAIIDNLTQNLTEYVKTFVDFDMDLNKLSKKEKLEFLYNYGNKMIDFLYTKISSDILLFMFREQQNSKTQINVPALKFMNKLFASILNKKENFVKALKMSILSYIDNEKIENNS